MRVALVCLNYPPEATGIAVYTGGLAEGLARRGDEVSVVSGLPHYPQWKVHPGAKQATTREAGGGLIDILVRRRRHVVPSDPKLINRLFMELTFGMNAAIARWNNPDAVIVVSPALFSSIIATLRALVTRKPVIVWLQDIYSLGVSETGMGDAKTGRVLLLAERWLFRRAAVVVTIHERFKSYLVREMDLDPERVAVVRNWSHIDDLPAGDRSALRARLGWPDNATVVLHAGNMGAKQGLENVIEASQLAAERGEELLFVLMGDGNQRPLLEAAGGNDHLRIIDPLPREEFLDALSAADILLVNEKPGLTEMAVPSKLTSYFATGRPVIAATDASSVTAEEIELAGAGLRIDAGKPELLVDAALRLRADPQLATELGERGQRFREATLTEDASISAFSKLLLSIAGQ